MVRSSQYLHARRDSWDLLDTLLDPLRAPHARRFDDAQLRRSLAERPASHIRAVLESQRLQIAWFETMQQQSLASTIPKQLRTYLALQAQRAKADWQLRHEGLKRAAEALNKAHLPWVVFKGGQMAVETTYRHGRPYARLAADIDILVSSQGLVNAVSALRNAGFQLDTSSEGVRDHECTLFGIGCAIDLHWHPFAPGRVPCKATASILNQRRSQIRSREAESDKQQPVIWLPSKTATLALLALHPAITEYVTRSLDKALDLDIWVRTSPTDSLAAACRIFNSVGLSTAAWCMLRWTQRWFGTPVPSFVWQALRPGHLRQFYLEAWLSRDPAALYRRATNLARVGFSLPLHDNIIGATRAIVWRQARHLLPARRM